MKTESTINEKQEKREKKEGKQSPTNHGCGCCKFCKVIISGKKPVEPFHECDKHKPYLCVFGCLDCNVPICRKCTKQEHNKHKICDLFELDEKTPSVIGKQRKGFLLPPRSTVVGSKFHNSYELVRHQAKNQAEVLHDVVDKVLHEALNLVDEMKFRDVEILKNETYIQELDPLAAKIDGPLDNQGDWAICNRDERVLDVKSILSEKIYFRAPIFLQGMPISKKIKAQFGIVKSSMIDKTKKDKSLMSKPTFLFEIDSRSKYTLHVRYFHSNKILVGGTDPKVYILNEKGECLGTFEIGTPTGLAVLDDGTILYTNISSKYVMRIKSDGTTEEFTRIEGEGEPYGICGTRCNEVIVCLQEISETGGKVVWFDPFGNLLREFTHVHLIYPTFVCENINYDICISDVTKRKIIVIDKDLDIRFMYEGNISTGDVVRFNPRDVCCDSVGHILVADFSNRMIHLLDEDGHFICYLMTKTDNLSCPHGLCVDKEDRLWVAERFSKKIRVFKFLT